MSQTIGVIINSNAAGVYEALLAILDAAVNYTVFIFPDGWRRLTGPRLTPKSILDLHYVEWINRLPNYNFEGASDPIPRDETAYDRIAASLADCHIERLIVLGGNESLVALRRLTEATGRIEHPLQYVVVPVSANNDIGVHDDLSPAIGFLSTADELGRRLRELRDQAGWHIVVIKGKRSGWLAIEAAGHAQADLCLIPEEIAGKGMELVYLAQAIAMSIMKKLTLTESRSGLCVVGEGMADVLRQVAFSRMRTMGEQRQCDPSFEIQLVEAIKRELQQLQSDIPILGDEFLVPSVDFANEADKVIAGNLGRSAVEALESLLSDLVLSSGADGSFHYVCDLFDGPKVVPRTVPLQICIPSAVEQHARISINELMGSLGITIAARCLPPNNAATLLRGKYSKALNIWYVRAIAS